MIPEIIENGVNGVVTNNEKELRDACITLLQDPQLVAKLGQEARKTILQKFSKERFLAQWDQIFRSVL
jgi:glycosyltransferase involved in cell wall biosynthesis